MSADLSRDLELWETGLLTTDALDGRHPGVDVLGLIELHRGLRSIASAPVPPAERVWTRVADQLPARPARRPAGLLRIALALALVLLILPGVAYASAPAVIEHASAEVIHAGFHLVGGHPHPHLLPAQTPSPSPHSSPSPHASPSPHR